MINVALHLVSVGNLVGGRLIQDMELKVVNTDPVSFVVFDVFGPHSAFNMQKLILFSAGKLHSHNRTLVVILLIVGKEVSGEASRLGEVDGFAKSLLISGVFAFAVDPNLILV